MKLFKVIPAIILSLILASGPAVGQVSGGAAPKLTGDARTTALGGGITIYDLSAAAGMPSTIYLEMIVFKPSAAGDYIQVRNGGASGNIIWPTNVAVTGDSQVLYYNGLNIKPYIVISECNLSTAANAYVTFVYSVR